VVTGRRRRGGGAYVFCAVSGGCHGGPAPALRRVLGQEEPRPPIATNAKWLTKLPSNLAMSTSNYNVMDRAQVAQHDAGHTRSPSGRARRTEAAVMFSTAMWMLALLMEDSSPTAWLGSGDDLAGSAAMQAQPVKTQAGSRPGRTSPSKDLSPSTGPTLRVYLFDFAVIAPRGDPS